MEYVDRLQQVLVVIRVEADLILYKMALKVIDHQAPQPRHGEYAQHGREKEEKNLEVLGLNVADLCKRYDTQHSHR